MGSAEEGHVVDRRDSIRGPGVARARWLDDHHDAPAVAGNDLGRIVRQACPSEGLEASIDIHAGGQRNGLVKAVVGYEYATAPGACELDPALHRANGPVLRARVRVVTAEKWPIDEHTAAIDHLTRGKLLHAYRLWDRLAGRVHRWRGAATGSDEREDKELEDRGT
ncbi:hypothetical protein [Sorangium sp. So ce124]|uniref:hypothetical protein n=1 Tax=Sorangium sp. So ce124 TaxID=3133280 RepID=UPI003F619FAE